MSDFGRSVRIHRRSRGLSQEQLAKRMTSLGIPTSQQTVYKIETGRRKLLASEVEAILGIFGITFEDFRGNTVRPRPEPTTTDLIENLQMALNALKEKMP